MTKKKFDKLTDEETKVLDAMPNVIADAPIPKVKTAFSRTPKETISSGKYTLHVWSDSVLVTQGDNDRMTVAQSDMPQFLKDLEHVQRRWAYGY